MKIQCGDRVMVAFPSGEREGIVSGIDCLDPQQKHPLFEPLGYTVEGRGFKMQCAASLLVAAPKPRRVVDISLGSGNPGKGVTVSFGDAVFNFTVEGSGGVRIDGDGSGGQSVVGGM